MDQGVDEQSVCCTWTALTCAEWLQADLLENGSFDEIISGSTYVMHCASPVSTLT